MRAPRSLSGLGAAALLLVSMGGCKTSTEEANTPPDTPPGSNPSALCEGPAENLDPGRVTLHRLNREEYNNTLRDLLEDDTRPADDFPADDHGHGFDNNADVLAMSPLLFEKYDLAAVAAVTSLLDPGAEPIDITVEGEDVGSDVGAEAGTAWNLWSNGQIDMTFTAEHEGEYELSVRAWGDWARNIPANMQFNIDRSPVISFDVEARRDNPAIYRTRVRLTRGGHVFSAEFTNDEWDPEQGIDRNLYIDFLRVQGPFDLAPVSDRRNRYVTCNPSNSSWAACAQEVLTAFARRAWRRPVTSEESQRLVALSQVAEAEGDDFDIGIALGMQAILLSPHFIFRVELDAEPTSAEPHPVTEHELATRLSYFLWSSMPDEELSRLADEGRLSDPATLAQQVRRMIQDEKAEAMVNNFAGQWLLTRALEDINPDYSVYPEFDEALRRSMRNETESVFRHFLRSEDHMLDMLDADFTFMNDRLASHYGLPLVGSDTVQRTELPADSNRRGVLTHAGLLSVTSFPKRTSPVKRGKFVLDEFLCAPPPAPPPGVENLIEDPAMVSGTLRERMEQHRADPACAGCHSSMDPIGFGLEQFDGIGRFRTDDENGIAIDSSGELPDGRTFTGAAELSTTIKNDERTKECLSERMMIYALGRGPASTDACIVKNVVDGFEKRGETIEAMAVGIATSRAFTHRRGEPEGGQ